MKKRLLNPVVILSVLTIAIICTVWSKVIFHPNTYLLSTGGDAVKNYYTPAWFVDNDKGLHFAGMHYPYGENVVFTDNQPLLSWAMNFIDDNVFSISGYTVGIMNILLFVSLFFCVFFIYKIMRFYVLPPYFAVVAAILIGLMNPQLDRFWGHFALGYAVFIPLVWYLILLLEKHQYQLWRWVFLIAVIILFGFIHIYYVLIGAMFILFHVFILLFKKGRNYKHLLLHAGAGIIPILFISLFMRFTDNISDRPESPFGFFLYKASFQSVFLPMEGTLKNQMTRILHLLPSNLEGYAYVGITGLLFLIVLPFIFIKRLIYKRSFFKSFINLPGGLGTWLASSVLLLLFSMTFPFSWNMEYLLDIITPLKQFRSPGRFAWGFYFVYTISLSVIIYILFKKIQKRNIVVAYIFIAVPLILQITDTYGYFVTTAKRMQKHNAVNPFSPSANTFGDIFSGTDQKRENFDAILFLPSFFQGSEKLYIDRTGGGFQYAMELSYETKLPLVNYMMSRTSFSQTLNNAQIVANPLINNTSGEGVFAAQHLLLAVMDKPLTAGEKYLTEHATKFAQRDGFTFYFLNTAIVKEKGDKIAIAEYAGLKDSLEKYPYSGGEYFSEKPISLFYRNAFDQPVNQNSFLGTGSFESDHEKKVMAEIPVETNEPIWIEISFWAKSGITSMAYPYIDVYFLDEKDKILQAASIAPTLSTDIMNGWVRAAENYEILPSVKKIRISCSDDSPVNFDELLVRHTAYNAYYDVISPEKFMVNNYIIGK